MRQIRIIRFLWALQMKSKKEYNWEQIWNSWVGKRITLSPTSQLHFGLYSEVASPPFKLYVVGLRWRKKSKASKWQHMRTDCRLIPPVFSQFPPNPQIGDNIDSWLYWATWSEPPDRSCGEVLSISKTCAVFFAVDSILTFTILWSSVDKFVATGKAFCIAVDMPRIR